VSTEKREGGRLKVLREKARGRGLGTAGREVMDSLPDLLMGEGFGETTPTHEETTPSDRTRTRIWRRRRAKEGVRPDAVTVIEPRQPGILARTREFWDYRRMTWFFGLMFIEKLYARTILGWVWIPLRPLIAVASRVLIFGGLLGAPSQGVPYFLFFLVGFGSWQFFSYLAFWGTRSLELGRRVFGKMYAPRLTALAGAVVPAGVNFLLNAAIMVVATIGFFISDGTTHLDGGVGTLLVFVGLGLELAIGMSIGLWTSVLNARARDVRFFMGTVLGFWFFLTPVIYPLSDVPGSFATVASLNPMTAPIELVRMGMFGVGGVPLTAVLSTAIFIVVVGGAGIRFFNRAERLALDSF